MVAALTIGFVVQALLILFLLLLIAKLMIVVAWSAPKEVRDDLVKVANRWFSTAAMLPVALLLLVVVGAVLLAGL